MSEETKVSNEAVVDSGTENVTQEVAQNEYIAESKKYRKRAQDAESQNAVLKKQLQDLEDSKLKEKEEYKTLYEKKSSENESLTAQANKWKTYEDNRKTKLLEQIPEDKREQFKNKDLETLELVVSTIAKQPSPEPQVRGAVKSPTKDISGWENMSKEDRKSNWSDIIAQYTKK
tara:strand:- start:46 stop:567 length:522 start_codon:yes stop_codon:yes gene_type:complete